MLHNFASLARSYLSQFCWYTVPLARTAEHRRTVSADARWYADLARCARGSTEAKFVRCRNCGGCSTTEGTASEEECATYPTPASVHVHSPRWYTATLAQAFRDLPLCGTVQSPCEIGTAVASCLLKTDRSTWVRGYIPADTYETCMVAERG